MPPIIATDELNVQTTVGQVTFGARNIAKVYVGNSLVFGGTQVFNLPSGVNVNLADFLSGAGANTTSPVVVNVAAGQIIGSNDPAIAALITGDLSIYNTVTFNLSGEIQGAPNGGLAFSASANITIANEGAIRGGGGNGGNGGNGGHGTSTTSHTSDQYEAHVYQWYYATLDLPSLQRSKWAGNDITGTHGTIYAWYGAPYWYRPGALSGVAGRYKISRGVAVTGVKGVGAAGGLGQGYLQVRTNGGAGGTGTYRAGNGGDGGNGGNWGEDGINGFNGGGGLYITTNSWNTNASGTSGTSGSSAGAAIDSGAAIVTLLGSGVVNGAVT